MSVPILREHNHQNGYPGRDRALPGHPTCHGQRAAAAQVLPVSKETSVEIQPKEPTARGSAEWFTGDVWIDGIARVQQPLTA